MEELWRRERHGPCGQFHPRYCDVCGNATCFDHECSWPEEDEKD